MSILTGIDSLFKTASAEASQAKDVATQITGIQSLFKTTSAPPTPTNQQLTQMQTIPSGLTTTQVLMLSVAASLAIYLVVKRK